MDCTPVRSRDIALIGYEKDSETLEIAFRSGGVYHYSKVPNITYEELMKADSHSLYFKNKIKNTYEYKKVH